MFSRILIKLIDQAIIPALLLLATRVVSIYIISHYASIPFSLNQNGFTFENPQDYMYINSYSIFSMILVLTTGLFYVLLKSFIFHETHISPGLTAKLFSLKLSVLIQSSFEVYSQGAVWLSYAYLLTFMTGFMAVFALLYPWIFYASLTLTILSTILFIIDVENELALAKGSYDDIDYLEG